MPRNLSELLWIVLYPLSCLWSLLTSGRRRFLQRGYQSSLPVICIGNIHSGGSSKTPVVIEVANHFKAKSPVILSRGYGRELKGNGLKVDSLETNGARLFGDEPWMIAKNVGVPVLLGKNRAALAKKAEKETLGNLLLLDDGFQNFSLKKRVSILCIQADKKLTEANCLPLGELREGLSALKEAHAVVLVRGRDALSFQIWKNYLETNFDLSVFEATPHYDAPPGLTEGHWVGFCGIASPLRFKNTLEELGCSHTFVPFKDHEPYSERQIQALIHLKNKHEVAGWVTTEKDFYKCIELFKNYKENLHFVKMVTQIEPGFWSFLERAIGA